MKSFKELGVGPQFIQALEENNITAPTEIQEKAIPFLMTEERDFIGQAQTGTGKTAAYGLPMLHKINPDVKQIQALVISPTRELTQQINKQLFRFTKYAEKKIFTEAVYGGEKIDVQIARLRRPTHIVVSTPGRLIDLLERNAINLEQVKTVVLDEADEMLSMGFKADVDKILAYTNSKKSRTWLFSATIPNALKEIIDEFMDDDAERLVVSNEKIVAKGIAHQYAVVDINDKFDVAVRFLKAQGDKRGIVFCRTKAGAQALAKQLYSKNIQAEAIHGDLGQRDRDRVMRLFKSKRLQVLVATDISARGIDVDNLAYVLHYQLPDQFEYYTHRSGRTARAGKKGFSLAFVAPSELGKIDELEEGLHISFEKVDLRQ
ncbi:DEAD/DEAH box helicase [Pelobium manganitolerans]|uniref:DEAD/DEAH box helicase n=1 Tax=Pelobium manganitolerans TaxID=1842495 RepID=A0A419S490_9SPHI|nr:DEAD/DEAH box helicase [Pelobium manganitolerans]RKD14484.1 DEAD/DEAH box helicase [Pelobium manganitolerans]